MADSQKLARKTNPPKYKKAPQAPRKAQIDSRGIIGRWAKRKEIAKLVSHAWKSLDDDDRMLWEEKARQDKARFQVEKAQYSGPWRVPRKKRMSPDERTPKRPMSAFLAFSHANRAEEKKKNPSLTNNEITRILAQQWKDAPNDQKKVYIDQEYELRQKYLEKIASWRRSQKDELLTQRQIREEWALKEVAEREKEVISQEVDYNSSNYEQNVHYFYSTGKSPPWSPYYYQDTRETQSKSYGSRNTYEAERLANTGEEYDSYSNFQHAHTPANSEYYSPPQHFDPHFHYQSHFAHSQGSRFQEGISHYFQPEGISSDYHVGSRRKGNYTERNAYIPPPSRSLHDCESQGVDTPQGQAVTTISYFPTYNIPMQRGYVPESEKEGSKNSGREYEDFNVPIAKGKAKEYKGNL